MVERILNLVISASRSLLKLRCRLDESFSNISVNVWHANFKQTKSKNTHIEKHSKKNIKQREILDFKLDITEKQKHNDAMVTFEGELRGHFDSLSVIWGWFRQWVHF